jgi:hypothetical protein
MVRNTNQTIKNQAAQNIYIMINFETIEREHLS